MRAVLIRHGETAHNAEGRTLGRADVPLTERGRAQAAALARALSNDPYGPFAAVYASPLQRALDTARPLAEVRGLEVRVEPRLIEMDIGALEDIGREELRERHGGFLRAWLSERVAEVRMPGGETLVEVQERAWGALEALRERHGDETIALVTHNFVILTLLCRALALPISHFRRLRHDVAAISVVDLAPGRSTVLAINDRCHLRELS